MGKIVILASIVVAVVAISIISGLLLEPENIQNSDTNTLILESEKNQQLQSFQSSNLLSCNCVAFRLDDVPSPFSNVESEVINMFMEKNIGLTLGIVGGWMKDGSGNVVHNEENKKRLVELIKEQSQTNNEILELANHSWLHRSLLNFDKDGQRERIMSSHNVLIEIFETKPTVYIPAFNDFNDDTIEILTENGYTHLSSGRNKDFAPFPMKDSEFYRFPATGLTGWQADSGEYITSTHQGAFSDVKKSLSKNGFAVVMMHAKDFTVIENDEHIDEIHPRKIEQLELLIKDIHDDGLRIVPLGKINLDS